jgi:hypothetical protein
MKADESTNFALWCVAVVLEKRRVPEAFSDEGSAGREGRVKVMLICFYLNI